MKGLSSPQVPGAWRFLYLCTAGALVLAALVLVLSSHLPHSDRRIISDLALISGGLVGCATCSWRRSTSTGRRARAWTLLAAAGAATALGNVLILVVHLSRPDDDGGTGVSSPAFVLALVCGLLGLGTFSAAPRRLTDLFRMVFDGVTISGALFIILVNRVPEMLQGPSTLNVLLPLIDVAVATFAVLIFLRASSRDRAVLVFLCGGSALYAATDIVFVLQKAFHPDHGYGTPTDVGWMAGYALIGLAALHPAAAATPREEGLKELSPVVGTVVIFSLVVGAAVSGMSLYSSEPAGSSAVPLLWLLVLVAIAARQLLLIADNDTLRFSLERMVRERTAELERAIQHSELLLSSVGEGIYGVDRAGVVTFVNPAGERTLGYRAEALIGHGAHTLFHADRSDGTPYPVASCYITEAIEQGLVTNAEEDVYRRADGGRFSVEVTATPLTGTGSQGGAVVVFRDITQRLEVDRLKSEFVSMVSHELRTPLTSIRGSLGLLVGGAMGTLPGNALRMVTLALDSCARLTRLINDILDIERIESGTMPMEFGDHRAAALVETAAEQLQILATQVGVTLTIAGTDGYVHADADRVVQTLINLMDNAIKFSPRGSTVEVTSTVLDDVVEFRVADQGRGIPQDKIDRIFSRFEQVDSSDARDKGGSGLGLAISRSVVERQGGRIWAESIEGLGATFRFTLPLATGPDHLGPARTGDGGATDVGRREPGRQDRHDHDSPEHAPVRATTG